MPFLVAQPGYRFVLLVLVIENEGGRDLQIRESNFRVKDEDGKGRDAYLAIVGGRMLPVGLREDGLASADLIFELPRGVDPAEFRYDPARFEAGTVVYKFR